MASGDIKLAYGTASQALTCTLASLTTGSCRQATSVDNSSILYSDVLIYLAIKLQTGTPGSDKCINVYAFGSEDGTNYDDNAGATDAAVTLRVPTNLRFIGRIETPDSGALTYKKLFTVARAFDGVLPAKWGIAVENRTNITLDATEGNHTKEYRGIYATVAP